MNILFKKLFATDAFKRFTKIDAQVAGLARRRQARTDFEGKLKAEIATAQARFNDDPSTANFETLATATARKDAYFLKNWVTPIEDSIGFETSAIWRSPESRSTLRDCLSEIRDGLMSALAEMKAKLRTAFAEAGDPNANLDTTSGVKKLQFQIHECTNFIGWFDFKDGVITDQVLMKVHALIRGNLPVMPEAAPKQEGMITLNERDRIEHGIAGNASEPRPENRRSVLPESWRGRHHKEGAHSL